MKQIVSGKNTDQLEKYLEPPLINDEREATRPEVARQAYDKKRQGQGAEKSDTLQLPLPHEEAPVEEQFPRLVDPQDEVE